MLGFNFCEGVGIFNAEGITGTCCGRHGSRGRTGLKGIEMIRSQVEIKLSRGWPLYKLGLRNRVDAAGANRENPTLHAEELYSQSEISHS